MRFSTRQQIQAEQHAHLAPKIIQMMEILQLSLPALEEKLAQELESNIALELVEPESSDELTHEESDDANENELVRLEEFEAQSESDHSDLSPRKQSPADGRDAKIDAMANIRARQESLSEQLLHQWSFAEVDNDCKALGNHLIGLIDSDGLLTSSNQELVKHIQQESKVSPTEEQIEVAIHALQKWLDPPGLAARTIQESFIIQIDAFSQDEPESWSDVRLLIETHLEGLLENKLPKIATESGIGLARVKKAMARMHELSISPGRLLSTDDVLPVIPDAIIEYDDELDEYIVGICNGNLPALRISSEYNTISKDKNADEQTLAFIKRNINSAQWIIEAVDQRNTTLLHVVQVVVQRQRDFLEQGDAFLRPLPMIEVADMLGIHVATVSRAVADKWIQTPRGIFSLRRFFSGGIGSRSDGDMSWEAVKTRLQKIVNEEDKEKPLSDEAIAKKLREQGIEIARRTIVKYRQQLSIPAARIRKEF